MLSVSTISGRVFTQHSKPYYESINRNHCKQQRSCLFLSKSHDGSSLDNQFIIMKTMEESDVGIFCFISQLPGFRGVLKQRYSDFIVNEVDLDGNVIHLTFLDAPPEPAEEREVKPSDQLHGSYADEIQSFRALVGDSDADSLKAFMDQISSVSEDMVESIILSSSSDKAHRTAVHNFFKEKFKSLVTDTVDGPDLSSKCIRVRLNSGRNNGGGRNGKKRKDRGDKPYDSRGSDYWPGHLGKFLRFHLYKENKDTQEALGLLGNMLGIQPRSFGFAGTKDKRSISTQRVTVFKQQASRLAALNKKLFGIKVGDFCYVKEGLLLGQLHGNRFTITLRGVVADSKDVIKSAANSLGSLGFINYFGLQRFGSGSVPTHLIGAALLRGEWKIAVNMILDPREGEKDSISRVREYFKESGDVDGTLRQLPRHLVAERAILQCLKKCPGNYLQALKAIPRTLRMMYVHSYQSYLWNHAASMRVQKHGTLVVVGDLVYCKGAYTEKETRVSNSDCEDDSGCNESHDCGRVDEISEIIVPEQKTNLVTVVNKEDLISENYTAEDVVLPLPGSKVIYPSNDIGQVYHDLAKKDGLNLTCSVHNVKEFSIASLTGAYRRVFQKPKDYEWEILTYRDANISLAETDLDLIAKSRPACSRVVEEGSANAVDDEKLSFDCQEETCFEDNELSVGKDETEVDREIKLQSQVAQVCSNAQEASLALKLSFTLPASCYATMAIRELLKTSTSVAFHKTLN